jgi:hypothetical protein
VHAQLLPVLRLDSSSSSERRLQQQLHVGHPWQMIAMLTTKMGMMTGNSQVDNQHMHDDRK